MFLIWNFEILIHFGRCACANNVIYSRENGKLRLCTILLVQNITDTLICQFSTGLNLIIVIYEINANLC